MFGIIASVAGPLISGVMQKGSADDAIDAQSAADERAIRLQEKQIEENRRQFDVTRGDLAPFREAGGAAVMRLRELMGLGGGGTAATSAPTAATTPAPPVETADAIRARLLPQFTRQTPGGTQQEYQGGVENSVRQMLIKDRNPHIYGAPVSTVDEAALNAAVQAELQRQEAARTTVASAAPPITGADSYQMFGDAPLLRRFTVNDFWSDPVTKLGFQFGLDRGTRGIEQNASRSGMRHSGNTLKALTQFGTDYAGTQAGASRDRFVGDQGNVYNRLAGLAGTGQTATNATGQFGANMTGTNTGITNNVAGLISSGGNARGAAAIAGGNAIGNAGNTISNWWNQQQMMDRLFPARSSIPSTFGYDSAGGPAYG